MSPVKFLAGYKTYIAVVGFVGGAVYHMSQGDYQGAYTLAVQAFGLFGARAAIANLSPPAPKPTPDPVPFAPAK